MNTSYLIPLLITVLGALIVFAFFFSLYIKFKALENRKISNANLAPTVSGTHLGDDSLTAAISGLVKIAKEFAPDHVVSVHTGGRLLASLVCKDLDIPPSRHHYCTTHRGTGGFPEIFFDGLNSKRLGKILIIDDISRGGKTLDVIYNYFLFLKASKRIEFSEMKFATLVTLADETKAATGYFSPDWSAHISNVKGFFLPWTALSTIAEMGKMLEPISNRKNHILEPVRAASIIHDEIVKDHRAALYFAENAVRNPSYFADAQTYPKILAIWKKNSNF